MTKNIESKKNSKKFKIQKIQKNLKSEMKFKKIIFLNFVSEKFHFFFECAMFLHLISHCLLLNHVFWSKDGDEIAPGS